uniref:Uncharacterized protein n=1 Tax=Anguilla anguilla TaxID=7936 RepID=A0A0E9PY69_ANGAN
MEQNRAEVVDWVEMRVSRDISVLVVFRDFYE